MNKAFFLKHLRVFNRSVFVFGATLLGLSLIWHWRCHVSNSSAKQRAEAIGNREGILIGMGSPDTFFVPPYEAKDAKLGGDIATAVTSAAIVPALDGIEDALRVYPPGFFGQHCKAIFLCGSLRFEGVPAGGTWRKSWIILSASDAFGEKGVYKNVYSGVHHEFSSTVWARFPELGQPWGALVPTRWRATSNEKQVLQATDTLLESASDGFLSPYGATNLENDFNVYAETVFTNPAHVEKQAAQYPVVAKKLALLMDAYIQLDARFEPVFDRMGLLRFRSELPASFREGVAIAPSVIPTGEIMVSQ